MKNEIRTNKLHEEVTDGVHDLKKMMERVKDDEELANLMAAVRDLSDQFTDLSKSIQKKMLDECVRTEYQTNFGKLSLASRTNYTLKSNKLLLEKIGQIAFVEVAKPSMSEIKKMFGEVFVNKMVKDGLVKESTSEYFRLNKKKS